MIAAPTPWTTRAAMRATNEGAAPQARGRHGEREARHEDLLGVVTVAYGAGGQEEGREGERVAVDHPLKTDSAAEVRTERLGGDVHDADVQDDDHETEAGREQRQSWPGLVGLGLSTVSFRRAGGRWLEPGDTQRSSGRLFAYKRTVRVYADHRTLCNPCTARLTDQASRDGATSHDGTEPRVDGTGGRATVGQPDSRRQPASHRTPPVPTLPRATYRWRRRCSPSPTRSARPW